MEFFLEAYDLSQLFQFSSAVNLHLRNVPAKKNIFLLMSHGHIDCPTKNFTDQLFEN